MTVSSKAMDVLHSRKTKVQSWYFDLSLYEKYWSEERVYHHTTPASMFYALREGLRIVFEEGLEARFKRHETLGDRLKMELEGLGFKLFARRGTVAHVDFSIPSSRSRRRADAKRLLNDYHIKSEGGLAS